MNPTTPDIQDQRHFWDDHWQRWEERKTLNDWARARGRRILAVLRSLRLENPKILDLGCGMGWFTEALAECGQATGIDLSAQAIDMARERRPDIPFFAANVLEDRLPGAPFDVVISQEVLAHVEDQPKYLRRAAEALYPGGYLIITTANKFVLDRMNMVSTFPPEHIELFVDMKKLKRLLRPCFDVQYATSVLPMGERGVLRIVNSSKLNKVVATILPQPAVERLKERAGFGYSLLVLARKKSVCSA